MEPVGTDERHEATWKGGALDGPILRPDDRDQLLARSGASREDEPSAVDELLVERARHRRCGRRDRDRIVRRLFRDAERPVPQTGVDPTVAGSRKSRARPVVQARTHARSSSPRRQVRRAPRPGSRIRFRHRARALPLKARGASRSHRRCTAARSSARSRSEARRPRTRTSTMLSGTKSSRGTVAIASSTRSSVIPRWRS